MKRLNLAVLACLAVVAPAFAADTNFVPSSQRKPVDYQVATPSNVAAAFRKADSINIMITEQVDGGFAHGRVTVRDRAWIERCAQIFDSSSFETIPPCLCITAPQVEISQTGRQPLLIGLHGRNAVQFLGRSAGKYSIGSAQRDALAALIDEQKQTE